MSKDLAVNIKTKEEWRQVMDFYSDYYYDVPLDSGNICIDITDDGWENKEWFIESGYEVIDFEQWKRMVK